MKDYQFAYGKGSVTVPLDERSVRAVLHEKRGARDAGHPRGAC